MGKRTGEEDVGACGGVRKVVEAEFGKGREEGGRGRVDVVCVEEEMTGGGGGGRRVDGGSRRLSRG